MDIWRLLPIFQLYALARAYSCCQHFSYMLNVVLMHKKDGSIHRGSCMSAHVLLNLLNELGKRDKMRGLQ